MIHKLFPMDNITIYHKVGSSYNRYELESSFRQESSIKHENVGLNSSNNVLIRIFDENYNEEWFCDKGDIIVKGFADYDVKEAPMTELKERYGKDNVFKVMSVQDLFYDEDMGHLKVMCNNGFESKDQVI